MSNFRIKETEQGWIVEVLTYKWTLFGLKKVWKPFIKTSGLNSAWHHSQYKFALMNLIDKIKEDLKQ